MAVLALVPLVAWLFYVRRRFGASQEVLTLYNFSFPMQAMSAHFLDALRLCFRSGFGEFARQSGSLGRLYLNDHLHEALTISSLCAQGLYLVLRRDPFCAYWRTGICFLVLGCVLGAEVWGEASAAARVLLPMTACFYLRLSRERPVWFWPFFLLGTAAAPYRMHEFWMRF